MAAQERGIAERGIRVYPEVDHAVRRERFGVMAATATTEASSIAVLEPAEDQGLFEAARLDRSAGEGSTDALQLFLKEIGKVELLTAAEEVEVAKRI